MVYRAVYGVVLRRMPPEAAHAAGFWLIRAAAGVPGGARALRRFLAPRDPALRVRALGLDFPGPLGLAAGFDKDGRGVAGLAALGFGFVEVGTVTARPQPGNPKPRMFRFPAERALVNRMGFNNSGAAELAARLRALRGPRPVIGVNIGKTKAVPEAGAVADYVASARLVADVAGYVVVNVSSPNTPGLRDLQAADKLRPLLKAVREALDEASPRRRVPLLVKIAPDLADPDIDAVADLALELGLDGIIATNTTISREGLHDTAAVADAGPGGMSGAPLKARALEVLRRLNARTSGRLVLIAAGGIETPDDARARLAAGATLLQAYTAFIYEGPFWPSRMHAGLIVRELAMDAEPPEIDTSVPHSARIWNYWLGGKENYEADRTAGDQFLQAFPDIAVIARATREFMGRAIRYLAAEEGIRQFLDIGTGLPVADAAHEIAQQAAPESRVVYVDNDPVVQLHAQSLLASGPEGATDFIEADMREPGKIIAAAARTLDLSRPVAVLFMGVLGHVTDDAEAVTLVSTLMNAVPSGSYLVLSDGTAIPGAEQGQAAQDEYNESGAEPYFLRSPAQIARFLDGFALVPPGLVSVTRWRQEETSPEPPPEVDALGGVGRKS